tara:strand:- start:2167 stop:2457 length:291 start_codon:yes stop_codon:yes gene_type:complete
MNKKLTLDDMVYLCLKEGVTWWTYWSLQRVIKNKSGILYGEPSISAAIRNMRKPKQREKYNLRKHGDPLESRRRVSREGKKLRGYEWRLRGYCNGK